MRSDVTNRTWTALCARLSPKIGAAPLLDIIEALYNNPARPYHNLAHIHACIDLVNTHRDVAHAPDLVELALWLHDCVYDATRSDNEARSAAVSRIFARHLGCSPDQENLVADLIMTTKHLAPPPPGDHALISDIDMSILAAAPTQYDQYSKAIRAEYSFASDRDYRSGRSRFIEGVLARPTIFHTNVFQDLYEPAARENLRRELSELRASQSL